LTVISSTDPTAEMIQMFPDNACTENKLE